MKGTPEERFWPKVIPEPNSGCWLWLAAADEKGYGRFRGGYGRNVGAHVFSWVLAHGPVPDGLQLDHLCRTPCCVNPDHLDPVTPRENSLRGRSIFAQNARKMACKRGHPLAGDNLVVNRKGERHCRACRLAANRVQWRKTAHRRGPRSADKTHCPKGHEYTPENTLREPPTHARRCKICRAVQRAEAAARYRARAKTA